MRLEKKKTYKLEKCYSIAPLRYNGASHILVAAEKVNQCLLFDLEGNCEDVIWDGPGGTMSMVQVPGSDGQFLATQKFYSPNDSKEARIVLVTPVADGWTVQTVAELPFVHRFDIITRNGINYIIAATICSDRKFKDDWTAPGKVYACELPEHLESCDAEHPVPFEVIQDGLTKNHGYCRRIDEQGQYAVIGAEDGIYQVKPPCVKGGAWDVACLCQDAASDMTFVDFEGNGTPDMLTMSPFHGDTVRVYRMVEGKYQVVYTYDKPVEFAHGIWGGEVLGEPAAVIGHRKGSRDLLIVTYDKKAKTFGVEILDEDVGPANVYYYKNGSAECLVSTNREIDEIAFYEWHRH